MEVKKLTQRLMPLLMGDNSEPPSLGTQIKKAAKIIKQALNGVNTPS